MPVTMYTTQWCGFCRRLKGQLARAGVEVAEVDIERDPKAAEFVMSVNGGNQTVPTLLFPDGSTMINPSAAQVQARLAELAAARLETYFYGTRRAVSSGTHISFRWAVRNKGLA